MRAVMRDSTVCGSVSNVPSCFAAATSSRTKRGLPPARSPSARSSCSLSARSPASASASWVVASGVRGPSSSSAPYDSVTNVGPSGRRVTTTSHGTGAGPRVRCRSRNAEASSSQCASSITITLGSTSMRRRKCSTASWSRSCRKVVSSRSVSGVSGTLASNGIASSGSHGTRSGITAPTHGASNSPASDDVCSGVIPTSGRKRRCRAR